jgi:transposase
VLTVEDAIHWVGLDVHAAQTTVAVIDKATGELHRAKLRGSPSMVLDFIAGYDGRVIAVYEAGPTGMTLARQACALGIDMRVCAPGLIARKPSDRIKTDARDAEHLARQLAAGGLSFVRVPTVEEESLRDLVRAREDVRQDLTRARHRLSKFLLRRDLRYAAGGTWTQKHLHWIAQQTFDDLSARMTCAEYLNAVRVLMARRDLLEKTLDEVLPTTPYADTIYRLRTFRGIDTLTAFGLCAEIGDFARFAKPAQLTAYLGIVPAEYTTDTKRRLGSITKAGSSHARRLLVEAAWHYRRPPKVGETLQRRQRGVDPRVVAIAWRCQQRLYDRHRKLRDERRKPAGVVNIACARELACFVWEAATID